MFASSFVINPNFFRVLLDRDDDGGGGNDGNPDDGDDAGKPSYVAPATQDDFDRIIADRVRRAERAAEKKLREAQPDLEADIRKRIDAERAADDAKEQGKFKELYEAATATNVDLQKQIDALNAERVTATVEEIRKAAAAKYGLAPDLADRLRGDDEATIEADAQSIAKTLDVKPPDTEAGKGRQSTRRASGPALPARTHRFGTGLSIVAFPGKEPLNKEG